MPVGNFYSRIPEYTDQGLLDKYVQHTIELLAGQTDSMIDALETEIKKRGLALLAENVTKSIQALRDVDLRIMYDKESKRPKLYNETNLLLKEVEIEMEKRGLLMTKEKELTNDMFTNIPSMSDEALRTQLHKESEKSLLSGEPVKHLLLIEIEKEVEKRGLTMPTANYIQRVKELDDRSLLVEFKNQLPEGGSKYKEVHKEIMRRMDKGNPANESVLDLPLEQMSNDTLFMKQGFLNRQAAQIRDEILDRLKHAE